jgi:hypothetical protein
MRRRAIFFDFETSSLGSRGYQLEFGSALPISTASDCPAQ